MRNCYLIIMLFTAVVFAQDSKPNWVTDSWRNANYPTSEWYVGFAEDNFNGQVNSVDYQSIEKKAQTKLSESVRLTIQSSTNLTDENKQIQNNNKFDEIITSNYKQDVKTQTDNILAGLEIKSWFDKKNNTIYGFASVKKKDLANFYRGNINSLFSFANKEFALAQQLAEQDKKNAALEKIKAVEDSLKNVNFWNSLLQAVDGGGLYLEQEKNLLIEINNAKLQYQNSTAIYLEVADNEHFSDLEDQLAAKLQEEGCNCTTTEAKEEANYLIAIKSKLKECVINNSSQFVYCYTNATATVNNPKFKKPVNISVDAKSGWANGNQNKATEQSFKDLIKKLAQKINQTINQ